jgi:probable F420-dependent oxidoreductase
MLRFGFVPVTSPFQRLDTRLVTELEGLGCDSLWAPGHVTTGRPVPEAITAVAGLAALTRRATVGTSVLLLPLYHPVIVAKQFAELDRMTGGRVTLGVGVGGEYVSEFEACGVPVTERGRRTDESIEVMRALWSGQPVSRDGAFFPLREASVAPPPSRPGGPPIVIAGRKPPAMRRAAALGDGWMPFLYSPRNYQEAATTIKQHAASIGRDLSAFEWMCFVYVSVDDDPRRARQRALDYVSEGQVGDGGHFEALIDRVSVTGRPEQVAERLQEFVDAGARHFVVACCDRTGPLPTATRVLQEVVPLLSIPVEHERLDSSDR